MSVMEKGIATVNNRQLETSEIQEYWSVDLSMDPDTKH
jgi:hypothetical protein